MLAVRGRRRAATGVRSAIFTAVGSVVYVLVMFFVDPPVPAAARGVYDARSG
jgi:hypothetical protein